MRASTTLLPRMAEENGVFLCSNLNEPESARRYRVPVEHRPFKFFGYAFDRSMKAFASAGGGETARQIAAVLTKTGGAGLFSAKGWPMGGPDGTREPTQEEHGSVLIIPPQYWEEELEELNAWLPDGFQGDQADDLPYGMEDITVFAKINFTPDVWFYIKRGPLEGKIFRWVHDDRSELIEPWANDLIEWGTRVWREVPDLFGGVVRWNRAATPDKDCPANAELFPQTYVLE